MPYPPQNGVKSSSRFASLNVFKFNSGPGSAPLDAPPPPPPKDPAYVATSPDSTLYFPPSVSYNESLFSRSTASLSPSLSPDSISGPASPATPYPPMLSAGLQFAKRSNVAPSTANGRAAAGSPAPSASGGSLRSVARAGADYLSSPSMDGSTDSSGSCQNVSSNLNSNHGMYKLNGANSSTYTTGQVTTAGPKPKKSGVFKLASLAKRNKSRRDLSDTASTSGSVSRTPSVSEHEGIPASPDGDEGISGPWNFQHNIHVDEAYIGLPPSWTDALSEAGFHADEIAAIHARRRAAAAAVLASNDKLANSYFTERPAFPHVVTVTPPTTSASSSSTLLHPVPRSTSLGKGRDVIDIHPLSLYSVATTSGSSTIRAPSPAPSPRTPSFSMISFVSSIKNSLTSDSASTKDGVGGSRDGEGATGHESGQYTFVDGDGPEDDARQGMGDETLIKSYPFDTSSVSSHQIHGSRIRRTSQGQETPRTPNFPQIQVQRIPSDAGHVPLPSTSRAPSPLAHSTSLPLPTPARGYTLSNHSTSHAPSHSPAAAGTRPGPKRIYHVTNPSIDSSDGEKYAEPPPAYVSPKKGEWTPKKEKEGLGVMGGPPPPDTPIPPTPVEETVGEPSGVGSYDSRGGDQAISAPENSGDATGLFINDIPGTASEVLQISSYYSDSTPVHGGDAEMDSSQQARVSSPTPPLMIDKRPTKLAMLPPRLSFHQEGSLEDWSESLFSAIGGNRKRSSVLMRSQGEDAANVKKGWTTIRPTSPLSVTDGDALAMGLDSLAPEPMAPSLPDISFGANLTLGPQARGNIDIVEEVDEQEQAKEDEVAKTEEASEDGAEARTVVADSTTTAEEVKEADGPPIVRSTPVLPDVSFGPNVSSLGKDLDPPESTPSPPPESPRRTSIDSLPPPPPPKTKPKPAPLVLLPPATLTPPRTNVIPGISRRSPVNHLFGVKPQPLPVPIPPSQIRAQLRPAPPKPSHPPPTLPLPPIKRIPSQSNLPPPPQPQLSSVSSPQKAVKHGIIASQASPSDSRPSSSQTLLLERVNADRDSGMSSITVTPATIATAKVVRKVVASVIDSDAVSLASKRESVVSTANTESQSLAYVQPDMAGESPRTQEHGEAVDDSLVSETSSASLLRDGSQSKWPTPPPPPVELETDSTPHRLSRFRTTSLGRVTQLQAMGGGSVASPMSSHFSHESSETTSSTTSESAPLTTPKGVNGMSPSIVSKQKGGLAAEARLLSSTTDTFGGVDRGSEDEEEVEVSPQPSETPTSESQATMVPCAHPLLMQLQPYIAPRDPTACFTNLVEIAEGESGSVFAARVVTSCFASGGRGKQEGAESPIPPGMSLVAIKRIPLPPVSSSPLLSDNSSVSNKLASVLHELSLLKDLDHEHLLLLDAVYVGQSLGDAEEAEDASGVDTSLWIRMELMERSLADVIGLVAEGLVLQERLVGRFASDILHGLDYLQRQHIAHRDVRSDNLLVNATGVVKLADFSNAIRVDRDAPTVNGAVGVIYWQAPEMRAGPYNALKVDTWSLGATIWELAETVPPFSMPASPSTQVAFAIQNARHVGSQWPPLTHPEHYSRSFHEFLRLCGKESAARPGPRELLDTPFVRNACGRTVILQLLSQCRSIEEAVGAKEASAGQS